MFVTIAILSIFLNQCQSKPELQSTSPKLKFNDHECHLAGLGVGMIASEDMALGKHGVLFITSGDLFMTFTEGAAFANPGGIWVLDMRKGGAGEPRKIQVDLFPGGRRFQGHGLDVSNKTDRVYAVSHNGDHSSVDIFQISYKQDCLASVPWVCEPVSLSFLRSVTSNIFPNYGINDVVEAEDNQIYVTQWQPFSLPIRGKSNPDTWTEKLLEWSAWFVQKMGLKITTVFHCSWTENSDASCVVVTDQKFFGANGMTIDKDGDVVYVNDPEDKMITIMKRDKETGKLTKLSEIILPFVADNIEYDDETDEIIIGTILDVNAFFKKFAGEDVPVAGGLSIAQKTDGWKIHDVLNHDGTKLSQISAAAKWGDKVVLGSPFSEGILICKVE